ncbi:MAG: hypothetical protein HY698_08040 [Deltaproteobacteria bacterium]|nr:hypothetical protein [Deltaproteobacteria bacterium]
MPDYAKLRQLVSHRVTFEYDTGAKIIGYMAACKPATGTVQVVNMTKVDIVDGSGRVLEHHDSFSMVPNALAGVLVTEGPRGREA